ncbi:MULTISPECIES: YtxH domain-containing protein [Enterococcus]|uniref:Uncharacterized protein n=1 Tax=Candidatus Enterococcus ferrettii TaxID=2815324 RepID=A0ABV0EUP9_9ENTE|nr:YtxH domain-containing protein [Enterococcus sp. 665A]MBO1339434.1 YtxH domain-containing protein [Enterococcus sp. 665A]
MKKNLLDKTILVLVVASLGLVAVNRYVFQPIWKAEAKKEMVALKQELKEEQQDVKSEVVDTVKSVKEEVKDATATSKIQLKEALN